MPRMSSSDTISRSSIHLCKPPTSAVIYPISNRNKAEVVITTSAPLSVATSESWRDQASGERRTRTEWHRVVIFNEGLGRIADQYLTKGAKVYVEGMLRTRKWQDTEGHNRYSTEIHLTPYNRTLTFLDPRKSGEGASADGSPHDPGNDVSY
jgi:single-strand DNA-binding protein